VRVPEDVAPGTAVVRVRARDRDLGLNGHVQYGFSPLTQAQHGAVFGIKPDTGKIYVKAVGLDHEQSAVSSHILPQSTISVDPSQLDGEVDVVVSVKALNFSLSRGSMSK